MLKKWFIGSLLVVAVLAFIIWIVISLNNLNKVDLIINTSPLVVDVKIDGVVYESQPSGSTYRVEANTEIIVILSREGFAETKLTHTVTDQDDSNILYTSLQPSTFEAEEILRTSEEAANRESVTTDAYLKLLDEINHEFPVLSELPQYGRYYTMSQGLSLKNPGDPKAFAIYVDIFSQFSEEGRRDALEFLKDKGYNPDDFEIIFREEKYRVRGD